MPDLESPIASSKKRNWINPGTQRDEPWTPDTRLDQSGARHHRYILTSALNVGQTLDGSASPLLLPHWFLQPNQIRSIPPAPSINTGGAGAPFGCSPLTEMLAGKWQLLLVAQALLVPWVRGGGPALPDEASVRGLVVEFKRLAREYHAETGNNQARDAVDLDDEVEPSSLVKDPLGDLDDEVEASSLVNDPLEDLDDVPNNPELLLEQMVGTCINLNLQLWHLFLFRRAKETESASAAIAALQQFLGAATFATTLDAFEDDLERFLKRHYQLFLLNRLLETLTDYRSSKAPQRHGIAPAQPLYDMIQLSMRLYRNAVWTGISSGRFWPTQYLQQPPNADLFTKERFYDQQAELDEAMNRDYEQLLEALSTISTDFEYPGHVIYLLLLRTIMEACHFLPFLADPPSQPPQQLPVWSLRYTLVKKATADFMTGVVIKTTVSLLELIPKKTRCLDSCLLGPLNFFCNNGPASLFRSADYSWYSTNLRWERGLLRLVQDDLNGLRQLRPPERCLCAKPVLDNVISIAQELPRHPNWFAGDINEIVKQVQFGLAPLIQQVEQSDAADETAKIRRNASLVVTYFPTLVIYGLFEPYIDHYSLDCLALACFPLLCGLACTLEYWETGSADGGPEYTALKVDRHSTKSARRGDLGSRHPLDGYEPIE